MRVIDAVKETIADVSSASSSSEKFIEFLGVLTLYRLWRWANDSVVSNPRAILGRRQRRRGQAFLSHADAVQAHEWKHAMGRGRLVPGPARPSTKPGVVCVHICVMSDALHWREYTWSTYNFSFGFRPFIDEKLPSLWLLYRMKAWTICSFTVEGDGRGVVNFKFPLQPRQEFNITQYEELGLRGSKKWLNYQFSLPHIYISLSDGWENVLFELGSRRVSVFAYYSWSDPFKLSLNQHLFFT